MTEMTSKERVVRALRGDIPDRVPTLTFGIDPKIMFAVGDGSISRTYDVLGLDVFPMFCQNWCQDVPLNAGLSREIPEDQQTSGGTYAGWNGVDEFGRLWERGSYIGGVLKNEQDIERYVPELMLDKRMDPDKTRGAVKGRPDKA